MCIYLTGYQYETVLDSIMMNICSTGFFFLNLEGLCCSRLIRFSHDNGWVNVLRILLGHDLVELLTDDASAIDGGLQTENSEQFPVFLQLLFVKRLEMGDMWQQEFAISYGKFLHGLEVTQVIFGILCT